MMDGNALPKQGLRNKIESTKQSNEDNNLTSTLLLKVKVAKGLMLKCCRPDMCILGSMHQTYFVSEKCYTVSKRKLQVIFKSGKYGDTLLNRCKCLLSILSPIPVGTEK